MAVLGNEPLKGRVSRRQVTRTRCEVWDEECVVRSLLHCNCTDVLRPGMEDEKASLLSCLVWRVSNKEPEYTTKETQVTEKGEVDLKISACDCFQWKPGEGGHLVQSSRR